MEKEIIEQMKDELQAVFERWKKQGFIESDNYKNFCNLTWDGFITLQAKITDKVDEWITENEYKGGNNE